MRLIDTHCHLTMKEYAGKVAEVLERSLQAGVDRWITIGTDLEDSEAGTGLCREHGDLYCTVGIHPHEAGQAEKGYLEQIRLWAGQERVCALGEMGLDYHYDNSSRADQQRVFADQLELAGHLDLPVVIHCREAFEDGWAILDESGLGAGKGVFHCFSGDKKTARQVLDRGFYISFTGTITYKSAEKTREAARYAPSDRIFLETDCPYMSPEPKRKVHPNEPALLVHIAQKLAEVRGVTRDEIAAITTANARRFFGWDNPSEKGK